MMKRQKKRLLCIRRNTHQEKTRTESSKHQKQEKIKETLAFNDQKRERSRKLFEKG